MISNKVLLFGIIITLSCSFVQTNKIKNADKIYQFVKDIDLVEGYSYDTLSAFSKYLLNIPLKESSTVKLYNGQSKSNQNAHFKILDIDVGNKDLQQCADAVMRIRAEFLFKNKLFDQISFHFVSGHLYKYSQYRLGYRPVINGQNVNFIKNSKVDTTYSGFRNYLNIIFSYCGTASLIKELKTKSIEQIKPGDVFIQKGNPYGHAVIVIAVSKHNNKTQFMLAQSYMPAQDIHILNNPNSQNSPWYDVVNGDIETPEWTFTSQDLKTW